MEQVVVGGFGGGGGFGGFGVADRPAAAAALGRLVMWFTKKKSSEHALKELVDALSHSLGPKLLSVILYGSSASGEFREGRSDVNVFILIE